MARSRVRVRGSLDRPYQGSGGAGMVKVIRHALTSDFEGKA